MNRRPVPEAALEDPNSVEMFSVWIAGKAMHCSIKVGMYRAMGVDEEAAWGRILADAARHVANALAEIESKDPGAVLGKIRSSLERELDSPTSGASGKFVGQSRGPGRS